MKNNKNLFNLFFTMFKIGLFTFGGGYAMIALLESELVEKKKWIKKEEFLDMIAISESTPGPIAINSATYVGYLVGKFWGSLLATIAVTLPAFLITFVISLFLDKFLYLEYVGYAFKGIQVCVTFLILSAGYKMFKEMEKNLFNIVIFSLTTLCVILFTIFGVSFSSVLYIIITAIVGVFVYLIKKLTRKENEKWFTLNCFLPF